MSRFCLKQVLFWMNEAKIPYPFNFPTSFCRKEIEREDPSSFQIQIKMRKLNVDRYDNLYIILFECQ